MRYLNKIIFLNSAHIPYAEIKLDGNVHFIGTQGVGKSTLLRAILFFYNADKLRLGIPKEKKSFDAFYFPYANSYIIYEVMREHGAYCVLTAKSLGRVYFRFIDAPFQREWFINDRNEVHTEWSHVRDGIGSKIQITKQITGYEMYRDIIFGNNRKQEMIPYRKFAIVESAKYQNIPRTIQNVFLNSKLDADFIKDTIIRSMSDEDVSIDMDFYRGQIKEFEQEYRDVMLWYTPNKNGEIPVRKMAEKVMNAYRDLIYTHKQIDEGRAELNFAEKRTLQEIPLMKEEIAKMESEHERILRLMGELQQKYAKEHDGLIADRSIINDFLKQVRDKRMHYEEVQIEEIIKRVSREEMWTLELEQVRGMKSELTKAYDDVLSKYRLLLDKLEADFRTSENNRQTQIFVKKSEVTAKQEELMQRLREEEEKVRLAQEERFQTVDNRIRQLHEEQSQWKLQLQKISYEHPHQKEMEGCEEGINELRKIDRELELNIRRQQIEINQLRQECELKRKDVKWEFQTKMEAIRKERATIENQLQSLDTLIEKRKGSLCEWLEQNKPGWQDTIGKVADEEQVLYNNELHPQLVGNENTLFGISLNLEAMDRSVRTPEEMKLEREQRQIVWQSCTDKLKHLSEEEVEAVSSLEKKYSRQIRDLSEKQHLMEAERMQIPVKLKNLQADYASWRTKEEEWKRSRTEELQMKSNETAHRLYLIEEEKKKLQMERDKQLKACQKSYKDAKTEVLNEQELFIADIRQEIDGLKQQMEQRKKELQRALEDELNGKGADTATIRKYDDRLDIIKKELEYINRYRPEALFYEKDKKDFLDKEPMVRNRKKELDTKLTALDERFVLRKEKYQIQLKEVDDKLGRMNKELHAMEEGLNKVDMFRKDRTFCPLEILEPGEKTTRKSCDLIVEELKSLIVSTIKKTDEFKKIVTQFNGNFSPKNTFHFRAELVGEQDYCDFAANLCEFVDNDKISEYQKHISERYTDIIRRISKEVGDLTRNESEIHKTIHAINDDFIERNFAGVIKEIALRPLQSSDKLMQLLLEIKRFSDENQHNMGKMDLFSQDTREDVNATAVRYLLSFMKYLLDEPGRKRLALADTFKLEFRVKENDNDTGWVEKIANVGSDGTDILVKAMVNIMLINVFKEKASRKFGDFKIHCMMDEIGKLHPNNVKGILDFANCRNILLVNSSPTTYNVEDYRYTYLLSKDKRSNTQLVPLLSYNQKKE
ncbi:ATP-binding protein [Bacteroides bouchesdurhonensis]|uniref:ATP-binding protein n=1 Tax=Bacteroides bouchesdurhonensis TaxID=1841855 RepID=UPI00097F79B5|nr:ATP-binding protein [Bacteroides bouchesdurhonensis]